MQLASSWSSLNPQQSDVGAGGPGAEEHSGVPVTICDVSREMSECRDTGWPGGKLKGPSTPSQLIFRGRVCERQMWQLLIFTIISPKVTGFLLHHMRTFHSANESPNPRNTF